MVDVFNYAYRIAHFINIIVKVIAIKVSHFNLLKRESGDALLKLCNRKLESMISKPQHHNEKLKLNPALK